jgi:hypothetical protein
LLSIDAKTFPGKPAKAPVGSEIMSRHKPATTTSGEFSLEQKARFAGGRRRYHAQMRMLRSLRRVEVARLMSESAIHVRGWQSKIAADLNVHRSTITRDIAAIREIANRERA